MASNDDEIGAAEIRHAQSLWQVKQEEDGETEREEDAAAPQDAGDGGEANGGGVGGGDRNGATEASEPTTSSSSSSEADAEEDLIRLMDRIGFGHVQQAMPPREKLLASYDLEGVARLIKEGKCENVIVMCGAGISVAAGIPDFRTPGTGLYSKLRDYGLPHPEAVFDISFFRRNPEPFYRLSQELFPSGKYKPTLAHHFVRLLHDKGLLLRCFTQNIDSLETAAGLPADRLVAAHGNFDSATCIANGKKVPIPELRKAIFDGCNDDGDDGSDDATLRGRGRRGKRGWEKLKKKYGGLVKPDIVFFGEDLPAAFFERAAEDFPRCDLLVVMGTSLVVQPFASLVGRVREDCPRLLINRERVGEMDLRSAFMGGAGDPGFRFDRGNYRDALFLGDCDEGVERLADLLGWGEDLTKLARAA